MESTSQESQTSTSEEEKKVYVSYSQMRKYRGCRYDWYQHYVEGLRLRGVEIPRLRLGSLVHTGLEAAFRAHYEGENPLENDCIDDAMCEKHEKYIESLGGEEKLDLEYLAEANAQRDLAIRIAERAIDWLDLSKWEVVKTFFGGNKPIPLIEQELIIPIPRWDGYLGYVDAVLREKSTGNIYVFDHKVRKAFMTYENEETNEQFAVYQHLLAHFGITLSGTITFQIKNREPEMPVMTQKGTLSKKKITTDWETYCQAIEACGFNEEDYSGVKEWASKVEFQRLSRNYRSDTEVENIWAEVEACAVEMKSPTLVCYRNLRPGYTGCHDCQNRELCLTELRGGDVKWIKKSRYRHKSEPNILPARVEDVNLLEGVDTSEVFNGG